MSAHLICTVVEIYALNDVKHINEDVDWEIRHVCYAVVVRMCHRRQLECCPRQEWRTWASIPWYCFVTCDRIGHDIVEE